MQTRVVSWGPFFGTGPSFFCVKQAVRSRRMKDSRTLFGRGRGLYIVVTSPSIDHASLAGAAVLRGVPALQLREKDVDDAGLVSLAAQMRRATAGTRTVFIVNDRPDVAALVGADGVHVGRSDVDCAAAREIVGDDALVGVSVHDPGQALAAVRAGADYLGAGPVYPTTTKADAEEPIGIEGLEAIVRSARGLPVVAIGGIDGGNIARIIATGAAYAAVVSAVCHAPDPAAAIDVLMATMNEVAEDGERPDR